MTPPTAEGTVMSSPLSSLRRGARDPSLVSLASFDSSNSLVSLGGGSPASSHAGTSAGPDSPALGPRSDPLGASVVSSGTITTPAPTTTTSGPATPPAVAPGEFTYARAADALARPRCPFWFVDTQAGCKAGPECPFHHDGQLQLPTRPWPRAKDLVFAESAWERRRRLEHAHRGSSSANHSRGSAMAPMMGTELSVLAGPLTGSTPSRPAHAFASEPPFAPAETFAPAGAAFGARDDRLGRRSHGRGGSGGGVGGDGGGGGRARGARGRGAYVGAGDARDRRGRGSRESGVGFERVEGSEPVGALYHRPEFVGLGAFEPSYGGGVGGMDATAWLPFPGAGAPSAVGHAGSLRDGFLWR